VIQAAGFVADPSKVVVIGHSAGGTLGLWAAQSSAAARDPVAVVVPAVVVAIAPIGDLEAG
jgi:acetyl esterase/lipase